MHIATASIVVIGKKILILNEKNNKPQKIMFFFNERNEEVEKLPEEGTKNTDAVMLRK